MFAVGVPADLVVELGRSFNVTRGDLVLAADGSEDGLLDFLQGCLIFLDLSCGWLFPRQFEFGRRAGLLEHQEKLRRVLMRLGEDDVYAVFTPNLLSPLLLQTLVVERIDVYASESTWGEAANDTHDVLAGLHSILILPRVDIPGTRAIRRARKHYACFVHLLQLFDSLPLPKIPAKVACMSVGVSVLTGNIDVGH